MTFPCKANNKDSRTVLPVKISKDEAAGKIFQHDSMKATTHADGHQTESVTTVSAGEAVTMPKEWTGIWDTDGYEKI
ncbi:MAG: hypothetical protein ACI9ON_001519 [Limisphaerales bacterium]|jgi:hypothetical protein